VEAHGLIGARNIKAGLAMLALSLVGGLAMSLYAFVPMLPVPEGLRNYDDLCRRLLRLAHIAAVMLPILNLVLGLLIDRIRLSPAWKRLWSALLIFGALGLPAALTLEALWIPARSLHPSGVPAIAFTIAVAGLAIGAWRTPSKDLSGAQITL
jgi:hypothetical protein